MDLIKNFDFAEFDHDKILENVTPILLPERNVTSDQVSCKVPGMEDVRMLFTICQDEKLYLLTKKVLMREKVLLDELTDRVKKMDYDWQIDNLKDYGIGKENSYDSYMLSNLYYSYGAAAIALPQVQAWMYMKFKCNLLIQLWNIHHVVVIPENTLPEDYDPQFFIDEIKRANRETIPEEEWLSDRLYYVDYKKKKNHLRTFV